MTLLEWHDLNAWVLIWSNAALGLWFNSAQFAPQLRHRFIWPATVVVQATVFTQAIVGVLIVNRTELELDDMHALYGFSTIIAVGILYSYRSSPFIRDRQWLLYGLGSWFVMGLGLRNLYLH